jgi:hypothetical protein
MTTSQRRLWLTAGWLAIAYVVVTFAVSPAYTSVVTGIGDKPDDARKALVTSSMTSGYLGAYGELLAVLILLAGGLLTARLLRGTGEVTGWLSSCMSGAVVAYASVLISTGAATAAALYSAHHGLSLDAATAVAAVGNLGFSLSGAAAGVFVLAASGAIQLTKQLPSWFGYAGYVVGIICIVAVPAVTAGAPQVMLWYAWLVVLGVLALRRARRATAAPATLTADVTA